MSRIKIEQRVTRVAEQTLSGQGYVSIIDVLVGIGWLQQIHVQNWRKGRIPYLEQAIQANLNKISYAIKCFRKWALKAKLKPSSTAYLARTRGQRRELQFSKSGALKIEAVYRTHYVSPLLSEKKQQRLKEKLEQSPELVVFIIKKESKCSKCNKEMLKGDLLYIEGNQALCMVCAEFEKLIFLQSGDRQLTLKAKKHSPIHVVVLKFSSARKRYERQGILVQQQALEKAQISIGQS